MKRQRLWKNLDRVLSFTTLAIAIVGVIIIYSATHLQIGPENKDYFLKHLLWLGLGLVCLLGLLFIDYRLLGHLSFRLYGLGILLLLLLFLLGQRRVGAQRWFSLGVFSFQPAEFVKISVILALAQYLDKKRKFNDLRDFFIPLLIILIPMVLILKQPDLGTALVFLPILLIMLYAVEVHLLYLFLIISPLLSMVISWSLYLWVFYLLALGYFLYKIHLPLFDYLISILANLVAGLSLPFIWGLLKEYQQKRLLVFLDPNIDPLGAGYSLMQSKIAIGSGGFWGRGFLSGTQSHLNFLPEHHTDFIFALIGEEWGFFGSFALLTLYFIMLMEGIKIAIGARDRFGTLLATGIVTMLAFHIIVNVGMTMGIMPVVGLPLPLLSYGGSFLVMTMSSIGLLLNIRLQSHL